MAVGFPDASTRSTASIDACRFAEHAGSAAVRIVSMYSQYSTNACVTAAPP
jgi:hypothetical protein